MTTVGIIASRDLAARATALGVDYVEPTVVGNAVLLDDDQVPSLNPVFDDGTRYPSFAILLPGSIRVSDPGFDAGRVAGYFEAVFAELSRIALPGAKVVFGSGAARRVPEGVALDVAERTFARSLRVAVEAARAVDMEVLLEPLNKNECNLIHTLVEAVDFLDRFGLDDVRVVADLFHMEVEGEPLSVIADHIDRIGHAHIADSGRRWVGSGDGGWREFVATLQANGFDGPISLECVWGDDPDAEIAGSLASLRAL